MIKYDKHKQFDKEYFPEISLTMHEGIGVFNYGIGELAQIKCGKSQLISDLVYPINNQRSLLYVNEQNIMNNGTIDVLFENMCQQKRNIVVMDGQGVQDYSVIKKCIELTNIMVVHVNY